MHMNEYQKLAMRTAGELTNEDKLINAVFGLNGEAGEIADHIKKHMFQGHKLDGEKLVKELGDVLWYIALGAEALGINLEEVAQINIEKLKKRYPEGFSVERSVNRVED